MSAPACDFCTGTHYLSDQPAMGPCVCCTPEALQRAEALLTKRDATITAMSAPKSLPELLDELDGIVTDVRDRMAELERASEEREEEEEERKEYAEACENEHNIKMGELEREIEEVGSATKEALQAYLVSLGLAAAPVARPDGPLGDLCVAVGVVS